MIVCMKVYLGNIISIHKIRVTQTHKAVIIIGNQTYPQALIIHE